MSQLKQAYLDAATGVSNARVRLAHIEAEYAQAANDLQKAVKAESDALRAYAEEVGIPLCLVSLPAYWEGTPVPRSKEVA